MVRRGHAAIYEEELVPPHFNGRGNRCSSTRAHDVAREHTIIGKSGAGDGADGPTARDRKVEARDGVDAEIERLDRRLEAKSVEDVMLKSHGEQPGGKRGELVATQ